jgi:hypothetical protein
MPEGSPSQQMSREALRSLRFLCAACVHPASCMCLLTRDSRSKSNEVVDGFEPRRCYCLFGPSSALPFLTCANSRRGATNGGVRCVYQPQGRDIPLISSTETAVRPFRWRVVHFRERQTVLHISVFCPPPKRPSRPYHLAFPFTVLRLVTR